MKEKYEKVEILFLADIMMIHERRGYIYFGDISRFSRAFIYIIIVSVWKLHSSCYFAFTIFDSNFNRNA